MKMLKPLALLVFVMMGVSLWFGSRREEGEPGEDLRAESITPVQERAIGLRAAARIRRRYGDPAPDARDLDRLRRIGERIVSRSETSFPSYEFEFHLLADSVAVEAFALPGGEILVTSGLTRLLETDGRLASLLGHLVAHVVSRHGTDHIVKMRLPDDDSFPLLTADVDGSEQGAAPVDGVDRLIDSIVAMRYDRDDEIRADRLAVDIVGDAGFDPRGMIRTMEILQENSAARREFFSTHPSPDSRIERIRVAIHDRYPSGVPSGLTP